MGQIFNIPNIEDILHLPLKNPGPEAQEPLSPTAFYLKNKIEEENAKLAAGPRLETPPAEKSSPPPQTQTPIEKPDDRAADESWLGKQKERLRYQTEDFPEITWTIGLPPLYLNSQFDGFYVDSNEQIEKGFPILTIQPYDFRYVDNADSMPLYELITGRTFNFAVVADSSIDYNHSNQYGPSSITSMLQDLMKYDVAGEIRQLSNVSQGTLGSAMHQYGSFVPEATYRFIKSLEEGFKASGDTIPTQMMRLGTDVLHGLLLGAKADFPNIWQNSQTGLSWNFSIDLRSYATDFGVAGGQYEKDIILPMDAILALSLPKAGTVMAYIEPPYIKAKIPNVLNIEIGAITNTSWSIPMDEINFRGVPRHIRVTLTITDLYNVMVQGDSIDEGNKQTPTRNKFINLLRETPAFDVPNKDLWKHEFLRGGQSVSERATEAPTVKEDRRKFKYTKENLVSTKYKADKFEKALARSFGTNNVRLAFNPSSKDLAFQLPDKVDKFGHPGVTAFTLPNVTNIMGKINVQELMNGTVPLDLSKSFINIDFNGVDIDPFGNALDNISANAAGNLNNLLTNVLNPINMSNMTNGLFNSSPIETFNVLSDFSGNIIKDILQSIDGSSMDIKSPLGLVGTSIENIASILPDILQGTPTQETLLRQVVGDLVRNNTRLDSELRLSTVLQQILQRTVETLVDNVLKRTSVVQELNHMVDVARDILGSSLLVPPEVSDSMRTVTNTCSGCFLSSSLQSIMGCSLRTNNRTASIRIGDL